MRRRQRACEDLVADDPACVVVRHDPNREILERRRDVVAVVMERDRTRAADRGKELHPRDIVGGKPRDDVDLAPTLNFEAEREGRRAEHSPGGPASRRLVTAADKLGTHLPVVTEPTAEVRTACGP